MVRIMKKNLISIFTLVLLFTSLMFMSTGAKSQSDENDTIVILGTQTFLPGETDPFEWECQGDFTDCTEVIIFGEVN